MSLFLALYLFFPPLPALAAEGRAGALFDSLTQSPQDKAKAAAQQPKAGQSGPVAPLAPVVKPLGPQAGPEAGAEKPLREVVRERQQPQQAPPRQAQQQAGKSRAAGRDLTFTLTHDGQKRTALVHLPPQATAVGAAGKGQQARRLPLVVFLHGAGASAAAGMRQTNLTGLADRAGFVAVFPEGLGPEGGQTWNSWTCCGYARDNKIDDVGYLEALIERLKADALSGPLLDSRRIYLAGFSNGAMLASRFALERPGVAAAIAVVSGTLPCDLDPPQRSLPVLVIHGDQDRMARFGPTQAHPATGRACEDYPARAQVDYWVRGMGLSAKPRVLEHTRSRSRMEIYEGGDQEGPGRGALRGGARRGPCLARRRARGFPLLRHAHPRARRLGPGLGVPLAPQPGRAVAFREGAGEGAGHGPKARPAEVRPAEAREDEPREENALASAAGPWGFFPGFRARRRACRRRRCRRGW